MEGLIFGILRYCALSSITYLEPSLQSTSKEEFLASSSSLIIVFPSLSHQMSSSPSLAKPKTKLLINTWYVKKSVMFITNVCKELDIMLPISYHFLSPMVYVSR